MGFPSVRYSEVDGLSCSALLNRIRTSEYPDVQLEQ